MLQQSRPCLPAEHYMDAGFSTCSCGKITRNEANALMPVTQGDHDEYRQSGSADPFPVWFRKKYPTTMPV